jgi:hypothetical protein
VSQQPAWDGRRPMLVQSIGEKTSCPKCGGGLESDVDVTAGPYKSCFTCGGMYFDEVASLRPPHNPDLVANLHGKKGRPRALSTEDVHDVERALEDGEPIFSLADKYGTSWAMIYKIKSGQYFPRGTEGSLG